MNTLSNNYTKIFISLIISLLLFILVFKFQTQYNQQLNQKIKISAETLYTDQNKILDDVALQLIKKITLFPSAGFEAKNKIFNFLIPLNFDLNQN